MTDEPHGTLTIRTLAMPADTNPAGDIFGGWVLSQMDIAGGIVASRLARGAVATVAIDKMAFIAPVLLLDVVSLYAEVERIGHTSVAVRIEVTSARDRGTREVKVTDGLFTYVALDEAKRPRPIRDG